jgi:hypothetical protein
MRADLAWWRELEGTLASEVTADFREALKMSHLLLDGGTGVVLEGSLSSARCRDRPASTTTGSSASETDFTISDARVGGDVRPTHGTQEVVGGGVEVGQVVGAHESLREAHRPLIRA